MDPEFTRQPEVKQDKADAKQAEAPKGKGGRSGDAMGSVGENKARGGKKKTPVLEDHSEDAWSETAGRNTTQYKREQLSIGDTERVKDGKNEGLPDVPKAGVGIVGEEHDPAANKYKKGKYVTKAPVEKPAGAKPDFAEIAELSEAGTDVDRVKGTLNAPEVSQDLVPNSLFIGNKTYQEDVRQKNIGDCYFLAAILQVIHYDPTKIVNMMKQSGDTVTTTLYHREGHGLLATWKPTEISTKLGLISRYDKDKAKYERMGARVRLAYDPTLEKWSSSIDGTTLKISKTQLFEAALWVNCLEQAFSMFAQKYGQYGRGLNGEQKKERFDAIDNGFSGQCLHMFFGDDASSMKSFKTDDPEETMDMDDMQSLLKANKQIVKELIKLAKAQDGKAKRDVHMSCMVSEEGAAFRLDGYARVVLNDLQKVLDKQSSPSQDLVDAKQLLNDLLTANDKFYVNDVYNNSLDDTTKKGIKIDLENIAWTLENNSAFRALNLSSYRTLREAMGNVIEEAYNTKATTEAEKKSGDIFLYSDHIYNVDHVDLKDAEGNVLKDEKESKILKSLDARKSMVTVQNPHAQTKPNFHEEDTTPNSGEFEITLESFLRSTEYITSTTVKNRRV